MRVWVRSRRRAAGAALRSPLARAEPIAPNKGRRLVRNGADGDWSADGRRIALDRCGIQGTACFIYVMRSDGMKQRRLSLDGEYPTWSPNGQELAFEGPDARRGYNDA